MILIDIWGGPHQLTHVARLFAETEEEATAIAIVELRLNMLVSMRQSPLHVRKGFDNRCSPSSSPSQSSPSSST